MNNTVDLGPRRVSIVTLLAKTLAGLGGGVAGTVILLLVFFGASSTFSKMIQTELNEITPLFVFVFMALVFLASLGANVLGCLFMGLADREKYVRLTSAVFQIFVVNLLIFVILAPLYILFTNVNANVVIFLAGLQVVLSAQASFLVLEIVSDTTYALVGVYTAVLSSLTGTLLTLLIFQLTNKNVTLLLLTSLPLIWGVLGLFSGLFGFLYHALYELYGVDFLRSDTRFGRDVAYGEVNAQGLTEEDEKMLLENQEDEKGVDFLRKKKK